MKLKQIHRAWLLVLLLAGARLRAESADAPAPYKGAAGPFKVETAEYDWRDTNRNRMVPVKIYYPASGNGPFPVIIFSHGLGGSREGYEYLGRHWASAGYVSVHVQHIGSDDSVWRDVPLVDRMRAMGAAARDPRNIMNRPKDISLAIDEVLKMNGADGPLKGRLDTGRIGVAGHSFGAFTTLAVAGEVFTTPLGLEMSMADPRVKAAIAMSSPAPKNPKDYDTAFSGIKIPCFHMTGTLDDSPIGGTKAAERRVPFDHSKGADAYLLTFNGGDHMVFSGRLRGPGREMDEKFQPLILMSSTAFWDAYLKDNALAKAWLAGDFGKVLGEAGTFEKKLPTAAGKTKE